MRIRTAAFIVVIVTTWTSQLSGAEQVKRGTGILATEIVTVESTTALLTTGSGDGSVQVLVDGYGSFGSNTLDVDPTFDPPGPLGPAGTVYDSGLYFGPIGEFLTTSSYALGGPALPEIDFTTTSQVAAVSDFSVGDFDIHLVQNLTSRKPQGSTLVQTYQIRNARGSGQSVRLVRHLDGDLYFDGTLIDRGGRDSAGRVLYEFDSGDDPVEPDTYVGISTASISISGYSIWPFSFYDDILSNGGIPIAALNVVNGDSDDDGLTDSPYDITLSIQEDFYIANGATIVYSTSTIFGKGQTSGTDYVALGDSYSSGEGAGSYLAGSNTEDNQCHRSVNAYSKISNRLPEFLADAFYACSGDVSCHVDGADGCDWGDRQGDGETPQIEHPELSEETDIVTLSIGGNDARFGDVLIWCHQRPRPGTDLFETCEFYEPWGEIDRPIGEWIPLHLQNVVRPSVERALGAICDQAPNARVYLLGYPRLFPEDGSDCEELIRDGEPGSWSVEEQTWLNGIGDLLNDVLKAAAHTGGAKFVDVNSFGSLFRGHEMCAEDSWFNEPPNNAGVPALRNHENFHPTDQGQLLGYRDTLEAFLQQEKESWNCSLQRSSQPPSITPSQEQTDDASSLPTVGGLMIDAIAPTCASEKGLVEPGQELQVSAIQFGSNENVEFVLTLPDSEVSLGFATASSSGEISTTVTLPSYLGMEPFAAIEARGLGANGSPRVAIGSVSIGASDSQNSDGDAFPDNCDVCPLITDAGQEDSDWDGIGDACDICPTDPSNDSDGDGLCTGADPCPFDPTNDADGDGLCAPADNCPLVANAGQEDSDEDFVGDACDQCSGGPDVVCTFGDGFEAGDTSSWSNTVQ